MPQKSPLPSKNHEFLDQNYSSRVKHDLTTFPTTKNTNFKGQTFLTLYENKDLKNIYKN